MNTLGLLIANYVPILYMSITVKALSILNPEKSAPLHKKGANLFQAVLSPLKIMAPDKIIRASDKTAVRKPRNK
jgi:hypothetical protein